MGKVGGRQKTQRGVNFNVLLYICSDRLTISLIVMAWMLY